MMAEHRVPQRGQSTIERPLVAKNQGQPTMTREDPQEIVGRIVQKRYPLSRNESSGRGRVTQRVHSGCIMASSNQVMLLRQKRTMNVATQNTQKSHVQKKQSQRQAHEQENIGGISMLEGT
jgi:hypothetical protein